MGNKSNCRRQNFLEKYKLCLGYVHISSSAPRPFGTAYVPILLSEVEQEQRPSGNGDREAIVVGAGLCDGKGEHAYTAYAHIMIVNRLEANKERFRPDGFDQNRPQSI